MATTKIWPIHDNLKRVLDYAANPEKTEYDDLQQTLHYAGNREKTTGRDERTCFITGIGCKPETAYEQMSAVKERFGKSSGNLCYHAYQSFKPGEVTAEQCHEIGVELARRLWGKRFQVLVATHLDRGHLHTHFVINSVSFVDGKKFNCDKKAYYDMRKASDTLCQAHSLSVIKNPKGKTPRSIYFAEKNGEPTRDNLMREAIDKAADMSFTMAQFTAALKKQGYVMEMSPNRKYPTIRSVNSKKAVRLYRLGDEYLPDQLRQRILSNSATQRQQYYRFMAPAHQPTPKRMPCKGSIKTTRKMTGLRALYLYYCYRLGVIPKRNPQKPLSPEMREACRRMNEISRQVRLICDKKLDTEVDVQKLVSTNTETLNHLQTERNACYNRLRRCDDPNEITEIKKRRDSLTAQMMVLRKENKLAESISIRAVFMKEGIAIERKMRSETRDMGSKNTIKTREKRDLR